ncbi:MAG: hypothetical protein KF765_05690 [Parvibaculaceae bacterium]|nr:hypothetical protein [Parvibaculaceae bacterium]
MVDVDSDARSVPYGKSAGRRGRPVADRHEAERAGLMEMLVAGAGCALSVAITSLGIWKFIELVI